VVDPEHARKRLRSGADARRWWSVGAAITSLTGARTAAPASMGDCTKPRCLGGIRAFRSVFKSSCGFRVGGAKAHRARESARVGARKSPSGDLIGIKPQLGDNRACRTASLGRDGPGLNGAGFDFMIIQAAPKGPQAGDVGSSSVSLDLEQARRFQPRPPVKGRPSCPSVLSRAINPVRSALGLPKRRSQNAGATRLTAPAFEPGGKTVLPPPLP